MNSRITKLTLLIIIICSYTFSSEVLAINNTKMDESYCLSVNEMNTSVILLIGDGMGFAHVDLARLVEVGENNTLNIDKITSSYQIITNNVDNEVTDSAAAATALSTGNKTINGYLGIDKDENKLTTILEYARMNNKSTGVVTTTEITHATPAGFYSHTGSRYAEEEIKKYVLAPSADILLGGGKALFSSSELSTLSNYYEIAYNKSALEASSSNKILGLFADSHLPYVKDRTSIIPSLPIMTKIALDKLSMSQNGFFLMVEGGQIDFAGHANNKIDDALETIEFDQTVKVALNYVKTNTNTLLLVTADHETGGLQILGNSLDAKIPKFGMSENQNMSLRLNRIENITVSYSSTGHTASKVPLKIFTTNTDFVYPTDSILQNTEIFSLMNNFFQFQNTNVAYPISSSNSRNLSLNVSTRNNITQVPGFQTLIVLSIFLILFVRKRKLDT